MSEEDFDAELNKNMIPKPDATGKVIKRIIMQKIVLLVYPNGNLSISQSESRHWITDSKEMWKKKKKAKPKAVKKAVIEDAEQY